MLTRLSLHRFVSLGLMVFFLFGAHVSTSDAQGSTIYYVNASATGANTGTTWANAFTNLQSALAVAGPGSEIWVATGTYYPITPVDPNNVTAAERRVTFHLLSGVALFGGFTGSETRRDQRDQVANVTILSGDIDRNDAPDFGNTENNSRNVVTGSGTDASAILDGFVVTGGNASGPNFGGESEYGGGIFNASGSPTIRNSGIGGNQARWGGGIANSQGSNPTITNSNITGNIAFSDGGGIYNETNSNATVTNVTIAGNRAREQNAGGGGGVYNSNSSPSFTNVMIRGNSVLSAGGGVYNNDSSASFTNVEIIENEAFFEFGAGVYNFGSNSPSFNNVIVNDNVGNGVYNTTDDNATFTNVTIANNQGVGVINLGGTPSFTNVTIADNQDVGISNENSNGLFVDSTISGNQTRGVVNVVSSPTFINVSITGNRGTALGGGVLNDDNSDATFINVTIADNETDGNGGGMYNNNSSPVLLNSRITGNRAEQGGGILNFRGVPRLTNVVISGNRASIDGGGLYNGLGSEAVLTNVTISHNQATTGGGIYLDESTLRVRNSLIWGNNAARGSQIIVTAIGGTLIGQFLFDHTLVQDVDLSGERNGNLDGTGDPLFVAPVESERAPTSDGDYQLQSGSSAIDRGAQRFLNETQEDVPDLNGDGDEQDLIDIDLADNLRVAGAAVDLGAYETGSTPAPAPTAPSLQLSASSGGPGSRFVVRAANLPPNASIRLTINDTPVAGQAQQLSSDGEGNIRLLLDTAAADPGYYVIRLEAAGLAQPLVTGISIKANAAVRTPSGDGAIPINIPAGIARILQEVFLPLTIRS